MNLYLPLTILCCALGLFQLGFSNSSLNVPYKNVEQFLKESFKDRYDIDLTISTVTILFSVAVSIFWVGALVGGLCVGSIAERFGRNGGLLYPQLISILASILMGCCKLASSYEMLLLGRFLIGISGGIFSGVAALYNEEIAPIHIRGTLLLCNSLGVGIGILTAYVLGLPALLGGEDTWPILQAFNVAPSFLQCIILPFMPESPRYLIFSKDQNEEAEKALKKFRNESNVNEELEKIRVEEQNNDSKTIYSIWQLVTSNKLRLSLLVVIVLFLSDVMSGYAALEFYSTSFFESAGMDESNSQYVTIGLGAMRVIMTIVAMFLMDRLGRRTLELMGLAGIIICSVMITIALTYSTSEAAGVLLSILTITFVGFFSIGVYVVPYIVMAESFTHGPRGAAVSICGFVYTFGNILVALIFPQLQLLLLDYSFLPFLVIETIIFIFLFFYFPETKNRASCEISLLFQVPNAWRAAIGLKKTIIEEEPLKSKNYPRYGSETSSLY